MKALKLRASQDRNLSGSDIRVGAMLLALSVTGVATAQDFARRMTEFRQHVATRSAEKLVVPAQSPKQSVIDEAQQSRATRGAPVSDAAAPSTETTDSYIATSTAVAPAAAEKASASVGVAEAEREPALKAGLYTVQLGAAEERLASQAVARQLGSITAGSQVATFPGLVRHVSAEQETLDLKAYALAGGPLKLLANTGEFVGSLKIGVTTLGLPGRHKLSTPLTFQVLDEGIADPDNVLLDQTSPPFATVKIKTSEVRDPFVVRVASQFAPEGIPVTFNVSPMLFLKTDRKVIQGYGLETTHIYIYTMGVPDPKGIRVNIETDPSAHVADSHLELDATGNADTILRSDATGITTITASTAGFADVTKKIMFAAPWRTLAVSLLGGVMGGFVRLAPAMRRGKPKARVGLALLTSVLVGALVFGLTVLGVNVLPVEFAVRVGDVFVLVVSALGAYWGTAALKPLVTLKDAPG